MKVQEEVECSKIVIQKVTVKEEFVDVQIDVTYNEYIFSCIDKLYNEKVSKNLYYQWVAKHVKAPKVERKVGSSNFQHVQQDHNLIFTLTTCTLTMNEDLISKRFSRFLQSNFKC
jgi:hypothetical protein